MEKKTLVTLISLAAACVIALSGTIFFFATGERAKRKSSSLRKEYTTLVTNKDELARLVKELEESKKRAEKKLNSSERTVDRLYKRIEEEKRKIRLNQSRYRVY